MSQSPGAWLRSIASVTGANFFTSPETVMPFGPATVGGGPA
jgi:hypothetical protein